MKAHIEVMLEVGFELAQEVPALGHLRTLGLDARLLKRPEGGVQ